MSFSRGSVANSRFSTLQGPTSSSDPLLASHNVKTKGRRIVQRVHRSSVGSLFKQADEQASEKGQQKHAEESVEELKEHDISRNCVSNNRRYAFKRAGSTSSVCIGHDAEQAQVERLRASVMYQMSKSTRRDTCPFGRGEGGNSENAEESEVGCLSLFERELLITS